VRVLITGGLGFIGRWLAPHLAGQGHEVFSTYHRVPALGELRVEGATLLGCDQRDAGAVEECLRQVQPDRVYHLAAQSYPTVSWQQPALTLETNVVGTAHLFEAWRKLGLRGRIVVACSSAEYGLVKPEDTPTKETHPLRPLHPYGVSKVGQDLLSFQEHASYGTHVVRVRIFNTTGPGKTNDAPSDFARRVAEAEAGLRSKVIPVGNLDAKRSFCDVRDMVRALEAAIERGQAGDVYNAGATEAIPMRQLLDTLLELSGKGVRAEVDKALLRPTDEPIILGDSAKLRAATGWQPRVPLRQTLQDLLAWERARVARGG
jgi:GDP-4-dehydro-6-deoxy-D-mannose reductase